MSELTTPTKSPVKIVFDCSPVSMHSNEENHSSLIITKQVSQQSSIFPPEVRFNLSPESEKPFFQPPQSVKKAAAKKLFQSFTPVKFSSETNDNQIPSIIPSRPAIQAPRSPSIRSPLLSGSVKPASFPVPLSLAFVPPSPRSSSPVPPFSPTSYSPNNAFSAGSARFRPFSRPGTSHFNFDPASQAAFDQLIRYSLEEKSKQYARKRESTNIPSPTL
jgi:hypothetical protein